MSTDIYAKAVSYDLIERPADALAWQYKVEGQLKPEWLARLEWNGCVAHAAAPQPALAEALGNKTLRYQLTDWVVLTVAGEVNVLPDFFFGKRYKQAGSAA